MSKRPVTGLCLLLSALAAAPASAAPLTDLLAPAQAGVIAGQYVVTLNKPQAGDALAGLPLPDQVQQLLAGVGGGQVLYTYEYALRGFAVRLSPVQADLLRLNPLVERVSPDVVMQAVATQSGATWGIDRADQRDLPLNGQYGYPDQAGQGVHIYVIDTGINPNHGEFSGRVGSSRNFVAPPLFGSADPADWDDCNGHGTHVSGTTAGTTYGIAKKATVHAVRVLDCQGSGSGSAILAGIDWVVANHESPAVANLSLGTLTGRSTEQETAVRNLVNAGVAVAVAAGNDNKDACTTSPAAEPTVLTVGATESNDARASYSNYGTCLDLFGPGSNIVSASYSNNTGTATMSGTSMASPHVAGALALIRGQNPALTAAQAQAQLVSDTTAGKVTSPGSGSVNKLLYVSNSGTTPVDNPPLASFTFSCTDLSCAFDGSASTDDQGIAAYAWNFGDGSGGNGATVSHSYAAGGTYSVTLTVTDTVSQAHASSQSVTVTAAGGSAPCSNCTKTSGTLASGGTVYQPSSSGFTSAGGTFKGWLRGPVGADFDLYLEKYSSGLFGGSWSSVASATGNTASEDISYSGTSGTYRWRVKAYSGSGGYDLYVQNP